jgi:UDP-N-acetylglucosamine--N-acetylmuramyl-(pentapeptide) pyrophosphoryl-undecaprenol N-acetylglucosamine transferase
MPVRGGIGRYPRDAAAERFGLDAQRPTLLVLGGSQGSRAVNTIVMRLVERLSEAERRAWQFMHLTGAADEAGVRQAYASSGLTAWVAPFLTEMDAAYAQADAVLARAGASTVAELARCGLPAVLIPYPHAGAHQLANAEAVDAVGGGILLTEARATPERVLGAVRTLLGDDRLRAMMGRQMRLLDVDDAAERLSQTIIDLSHTSHPCSH